MSLPVRRSLAGLTALLLLWLIAGAGMAGSASASVTGQPSVESQLLSLTNSARASAGLPALSSSGTLQSIARSWSAHQATTGVLAHNPSLFSEVSGWTSMGENVAKAYSASQAESLFMGSSAHRANILNRHFSRVGIGVSRDSSGALWFTVDFEQPSGAAPAPAPAVKPTPKPTSVTARRAGTASRASRSTIRTRVPKPVVRVATTRAGQPLASDGQLSRQSLMLSSDSAYEAAPVVALADLSATPSPVVATATLVGFIASMTLAAAGLLLIGATRTRRRG